MISYSIHRLYQPRLKNSLLDGAKTSGFEDFSEGCINSILPSEKSSNREDFRTSPKGYFSTEAGISSQAIRSSLPIELPLQINLRLHINFFNKNWIVMIIRKNRINFFRLLIVCLFMSPLPLFSINSLRWKKAHVVQEIQSGPDFLIIGCMKSGTTQLTHFLSQHPNIGIFRKERHFFDNHFDKGPAWYHNCLPRRTEQILAVGEVSPNYICDKDVPARVFALYPHVKLIAILRDPADRAYSQYQMLMRNHRARVSFEEALTLEANQASSDIQKRSLPYYPYISASTYVKQLEKWLLLFQPDQMLIIFSEDLKNDPMNTLNKVCNFLEVPRFTEMPKEDLSLTTKYPPMTPEIRQYLDDLFLVYDLELEKLLGVPVPWRHKK